MDSMMAAAILSRHGSRNVASQFPVAPGRSGSATIV
jgi:hypothetical protein